MLAESEPVELTTRSTSSPSSVRPALALTAALEVETIRRVLLEAATSTTRETWATCTCPECSEDLSTGDLRSRSWSPDLGGRDAAPRGLGRVGEAGVVEPRVPSTADEVKNLSWDELAW